VSRIARFEMERSSEIMAKAVSLKRLKRRVETNVQEFFWTP